VELSVLRSERLVHDKQLKPMCCSAASGFAFQGLRFSGRIVSQQPGPCSSCTAQQEQASKLPVSVLKSVQRLAESFGVDPNSETDKAAYTLAPASLLSLLDVDLKTK
jgi:hypothetical protein